MKKKIITIKDILNSIKKIITIKNILNAFSLAVLGFVHEQKSF